MNRSMRPDVVKENVPLGSSRAATGSDQAPGPASTRSMQSEDQFPEDFPPLEDHPLPGIPNHFGPGEKQALVPVFGGLGKEMAAIHRKIDKDLGNLFIDAEADVSTYGLYSGGATEEGPQFYLIGFDPGAGNDWKKVHLEAVRILKECYGTKTAPPIRYTIEASCF
ncbi:hypothetical protein FKW77_008959 [Venturia effusa]|uniref:Uncharacterized protein n=1 Tax=Venturia effusa TaxID=50376 RepID=A0A517LCT9_9PEZI|nr:hypothetical protein FKW77_008959 [Venturia effusa]